MFNYNRFLRVRRQVRPPEVAQQKENAHTNQLTIELTCTNVMKRLTAWRREDVQPNMFTPSWSSSEDHMHCV